MNQPIAVNLLGPYQGYAGRYQIDEGRDLFAGRIVGTRDVITFEGRTASELAAAFRESVDDYLEFCATAGRSPETPDRTAAIAAGGSTPSAASRR